jgi:hypothetical protein
MQGEINVEHVINEARDRTRSIQAFQERMYRDTQARALEDWLSAEDKDEARDRWGSVLVEAIAK